LLEYQDQYIITILINNQEKENYENLVFHSDQGWQYQHNSYQERLKEKLKGLTLSSYRSQSLLVS